MQVALTWSALLCHLVRAVRDGRGQTDGYKWWNLALCEGKWAKWAFLLLSILVKFGCLPKVSSFFVLSFLRVQFHGSIFLKRDEQNSLIQLLALKCVLKHALNKVTVIKSRIRFMWHFKEKKILCQLLFLLARLLCPVNHWIFFLIEIWARSILSKNQDNCKNRLTLIRLYFCENVSIIHSLFKLFLSGEGEMYLKNNLPSSDQFYRVFLRRAAWDFTENFTCTSDLTCWISAINSPACFISKKNGWSSHAFWGAVSRWLVCSEICQTRLHACVLTARQWSQPLCTVHYPVRVTSKWRFHELKNAPVSVVTFFLSVTSLQVFVGAKSFCWA